MANRLIGINQWKARDNNGRFSGKWCALNSCGKSETEFPS